MASDFGARFDMEIDAAADPGAGDPRVAARQGRRLGGAVGTAAVPLRGGRLVLALAASVRFRRVRRRQAICVVQIVALIVAMCRRSTPPRQHRRCGRGAWQRSATRSWSTSCGCGDSTAPLDRRRRRVGAPRQTVMTGAARSASPRRRVSERVADVQQHLADAGDPLAGELSVELAAFVLLLLIASALVRCRRRAPRSRWLSVLWVLLVIGQYADVTAPALYGRDINLYWDLRYMPDVASMLVRVAPLWLVVLVAPAACCIVVLMSCSSDGRFGASAHGHAGRTRAPVARGAGGRGDRAVCRCSSADATELPVASGTFPTPVIADLRASGAARHRRAGRVDDARAEPADGLRPRARQGRGRPPGVRRVVRRGQLRPAGVRAPLAAEPRRARGGAFATPDREVVSAYVESPTFGGSSWLAHISLLSGVEVRDPDTNAQLMTQKRDTLVTAFSRQGYRTRRADARAVAAMAGRRLLRIRRDLRRRAARLPRPAVRLVGHSRSVRPSRKLDALEVSRRRRARHCSSFSPRSAPTRHSPRRRRISPTGARMLTDSPYEAADLKRAYDEEPDWMNLGPSYVDAVAYTYRDARRLPRASAPIATSILILIGDHQPPAAVSGEGAPWDVPVHVIAPAGSTPDRSAILARLTARGFPARARSAAAGTRQDAHAAADPARRLQQIPRAAL